MRDLLLGLRIRGKLLAAFGSILLLSGLLVFISGLGIAKIIHFKDVNEEMDMLRFRLEAMDVAAMEFMYEGFKSPSFLEKHEAAALTTFESNYKDASNILISIHTLYEDRDRLTLTSKRLVKMLDDVHTEFLSLVDLLEQRGFKDYGREGSLRTAIHAIENSQYEFDKVTMLMMRRHEKDFFLRKELKYRDEFNMRLENFKVQLVGTPSEKLIPILDNYKNEFNGVVDIETKIGLSAHEGIRGRIHKTFVNIRPEIESIRASLKVQNDRSIRTTRWSMWAIFAIQITIGITMALIYSNLLSTSIKEIRNAMQKLADGVFPEKFRISTTEEIGQTKLSFNQFVDRVRAATVFAESLGTGKGDSEYDKQFQHDVLAQSLIQAHEKLRASERVQQENNWITEGLSQFNEIIKNDANDTTVLAERVLRIMVCYPDANQGALYLLRNEDTEKYLERMATYAYGKKKFVNERIDCHSGLLGQCLQEGDIIYLRDIPHDFVRITSGLGEASPRNVIIAPLKTNDHVIGVLELASFRPLETHQIEFIKRATESIASLLSTKNAALETKRLLRESEERAAFLASQDEQMRQQTEELRATQEEMERQRMRLQEEIYVLKQRLSQVEVQTI